MLGPDRVKALTPTNTNQSCLRDRLLWPLTRFTDFPVLFIALFSPSSVYISRVARKRVISAVRFCSSTQLWNLKKARGNPARDKLCFIRCTRFESRNLFATCFSLLKTAVFQLTKLFSRRVARSLKLPLRVTWLKKKQARSWKSICRNLILTASKSFWIFFTPGKLESLKQTPKNWWWLLIILTSPTSKNCVQSF